MSLFVEYFTAQCCKGTELIEGWYWWDDENTQSIGGPYEDEWEAINAARKDNGWQ